MLQGNTLKKIKKHDKTNEILMNNHPYLAYQLLLHQYLSKPN